MTSNSSEIRIYNPMNLEDDIMELGSVKTFDSTRSISNSNCTAMGLSPDERYLAMGTRKGQIKIYEVVYMNEDRYIVNQ